MTTHEPLNASTSEDDLARFLIAEIDGVVRDMAGHVGDQIFDVLKRNGLLMRSEAAATCMMIEASVQMLAQAADQCSRAAEAPCHDAVIAVFIQLLRDRIDAQKEHPND